MSEFWEITFTDATVFWNAVEVIFTVITTIIATGAGFVIWMEVRNLRKESLAQKMSGLRQALEIMGTDDFKRAEENLLKLNDPYQKATHDPRGPDDVLTILRWLEVIHQLIENKYLDERLLFLVEAPRLGELYRSIGFYDHTYLVKKIEKSYIGGRELLRKARSWQQNYLSK